GFTLMVALGRYGFAVSQASAAPTVATEASDSATAAFAWKRSSNSIARRPAIGIAINVAQNVNRSNVRISNARPSNHLGNGVVPPRPKIKVSQKPKSNGRSLATDAPRMRMKGSARIRAPYGITK